MKKIMLIALLFFLLFPLFSQPEKVLEEILSELSETRDESEIEGLIEKISDLITEPLDLNFASEAELAACGLFSPFQIYGILKYRKKYGPFLSIYELASIPGFKKDYLINIESLLACESLSIAKADKKNAKGFTLSNISLTLPPALGFIHSDSLSAYYPGSRVKNSFRIKYEWGSNWSAGAAYERDAGEQWLNKKLPEHLCTYLRYAPGKILKECIVGNFRLHRGMGLVNGLGFSSRSANMELTGYRTSYAKPYASTMEYDYYRGIYTEFGVAKWKMDLYLSLKPEDLSFNNLNTNTDLFEKIRRTGLHRTPNESEGSGLSINSSGGLSISRINDRWNMGISISSSKLSLSQRGKDSLIITEPLFSWHSNLSLYGIAFGPSYEIYAEYAIDQELRSAILIGGKIDLNPALSASLNLRKYAPAYTAQYSTALSASSHPENETGFQIGFFLVPLKYVRLNILSDISHKINSLAKDITPGYSITSSLLLKIEASSLTRLEFRISSRMKDKIVLDDQPGNGNSFIKRSLRLRLHYAQIISERIDLQGRLELAFLPPVNGMEPASLFYQQISIDLLPPIKLSYRFALFNVADWESRIYAYEPGVRYSFSFPAFYGQGTRNLLVLASDLGKRITLRSLFGLTQYSYKRQIGSGYDQRNGRHTLNFEIQLQLDI